MLFAVLAMLSLAMADTATPPTEPCEGSAAPTVEPNLEAMMLCADRDYQAANAALERQLIINREVMTARDESAPAATGPGHLQLFEQAHHAWLSYRESSCSPDFLPDDDFPSQYFRLNCFSGETAEYTELLNGIAEFGLMPGSSTMGAPTAKPAFLAECIDPEGAEKFPGCAQDAIDKADAALKRQERMRIAKAESSEGPEAIKAGLIA